MNEELKKISFSGKTNRYQIKKLVTSERSPKLKKEVTKWDFEQGVYTEDIQKMFLKELYEQTNPCRESIIAKREIEKKLNSYKQQDIRKSRFSEVEFITFENATNELWKSSLLCYYCKCFVFLLYEHAREPCQWTLDRIDNSIGHNAGNVVISCLKCNLKRRKTNQTAFLFTKNLIIVKDQGVKL